MSVYENLLLSRFAEQALFCSGPCMAGVLLWMVSSQKPFLLLLDGSCMCMHVLHSADCMVEWQGKSVRQATSFALEACPPSCFAQLCNIMLCLVCGCCASQACLWSAQATYADVGYHDMGVRLRRYFGIGGFDNTTFGLETSRKQSS
jgi:hypothetical protein